MYEQQKQEEQVIETNYSSFLTDAELKERTFDIGKIYRISMVRESPHPQFDRMSYLKYNETNEQADMSYLAPKANKQDTVITSGITHEKDSTLLSMLTGFNFEGRVTCYYKNKELYDISNILTSWVRHTREVERYDEKRFDNYRNILVQGTAFVREKFVEMVVPNKVLIDEDIDFTQLEKVRWTLMGTKKIIEGAQSWLVDGKKVFLENIRVRDIRQQPRVYTIEYIPRDLLFPIFRNSSRWKYVPKQCNGGIGLVQLTQGTLYTDWTFAEVDFSKIEVIEAFCYVENRYQIYLNGVPMLPGGFPLTAISPSGLVPLAKGDIDPINLFAYSKSIPAKTKIDQAVYDAMLKLMIIKAQQAAYVPSVNNTGKMLSSRIFMPANMAEGFNGDMIQPLIKDPGIKSADFSFMEFLQNQIDSKSINAILEGQAGGSNTLGEYMDQQKKSMVKIGSIFDGIINWEKQMLQLRVANLLANGARKTSTTLGYKTISFKDTFQDDGSEGMQVVNFTDKNYATPDDVFDEELQAEKDSNENMRIAYIDPKLMKQMLVDPEYTFRYEVVPVDKNNDKLTKALFVGMVTQAANIFGMDSLAVDRLKKRYASVMGEQYDDLFLNEQEMQLKQLQMQQQMQMGAQPGSIPGAMPAPKQLAANDVFA